MHKLYCRSCTRSFDYNNQSIYLCPYCFEVYAQVTDLLGVAPKPVINKSEYNSVSSEISQQFSDAARLGNSTDILYFLILIIFGAISIGFYIFMDRPQMLALNSMSYFFITCVGMIMIFVSCVASILFLFRKSQKKLLII